MRKFRLTIWTLLMCFSTAQAQVILNSGDLGNQKLVDDFNSYQAAGFSPSPAAGQLNSNSWRATGFSDGTMAFGDAPAGADFGRGRNGGGVTSGGVYAFEVATGDFSLGVQPTGSDFNPGSFRLRCQNNTGATLEQIVITYELWVNNDGPRTNSFDLKFSATDVDGAYATTTGGTFASPADASTGWLLNNMTATVSGISVANGSFFYLGWFSADVQGSPTGARDEFALDDLKLTATGATSGGVANPGNFTATTASASDISLTWTLNNDNNSVLVAFNTSQTFGTPTGGYTLGQTISGGGQVIVAGSNTSVLHSGRAENTTYHYKAWSYNSGNTYSSGVNANATTLKNAPSNHVSGFTATANSPRRITVIWTDATRAAPDGYLIKASNAGAGAISNPTNGVAVTNDNQLGDGSAAVNVNPGVQSFFFENLSPTVTYTFKIFPYTNSGANIAYKTDGSVPTTSAVTPGIPAFTGLESFESASGSWDTYNVASNRNWTIATTGGGANGSGSYMACSGFGGDVASEDWLLIPTINLTGYTNPVLEFWEWVRFTDTINGLALKISTNYTVGGNPASASWTTLNFLNPTQDQTWTSSGDISLAAFASSSQVALAFHYQSSGTGSNAARNWQVDEVAIKSSSGVIDPTNFTATPTGASEIHLVWTRNVANDQILLAFNTSNSFGTPSGSYTAGQPIGTATVLAVGSLADFNHTGRNEATLYYYKIWSKNSDTYSAGITANARTFGSGDYYAGINNQTGPELKSILNALLRDTYFEDAVTNYDGVWDGLKYADEDPANPNNVILIYDGRSRAKSLQGTGADNWNREHVWPNGIGIDDKEPGYIDLHHLRPADVTVNSKRGSMDFDNGGTPYSDSDGFATGCFADANSFEPRPQDKGNVARMIFYMDARYEGSGGKDPYNLELIDTNHDPNNITNKLGVVSTLLAWHQADPVDALEMRRNERVAELQHNRNPFIDHPEWVNRIWSNAPPSTEVQFATATATVIEGNTYELEISLINPGAQATTVQVALTGGTAADINNYATQTVTFPAGSATAQKVLITVTDDNVSESNETLTFTLQNVSGGNTPVLGVRTQFQLTILDRTTVQFAAANATVIEGGSYQLAVSVTAPASGSATTVQLALTSGTAADVNNFATQTLTFPAGSAATQTVTLTVTEDALAEVSEILTFTLQNVTGGSNAKIGTQAQFQLTILDRTTVQFAAANATVIEGGSYQLVVSVTAPASGSATTVQLALTSGTAADVNNFATQTLTFPAGSAATQTVTLTVTEDALAEVSEILTFTLQNVTGGSNAKIGTQAQFQLTILDRTTVQFAAANATVIEGGSYQLSVSVTAPASGSATTVQLALTSGTAADVNNFATQTLTFPAGSAATQTVTLTITEDALAEVSESLTFTLQNVTGGSNAKIGTQAQFQLTILDRTTVQFAAANATVKEGDGSYTLEVLITAPSISGPTQIDVALTAGSAEDVGNFSTKRLTFAAGGAILQTVSLNITDDSTIENVEAITFSLQNLSGGNSAKLGTPAQFELTIEDNDEPAPVVSNVAVSNITATTARISFSTDKLTTAIIHYGMQSGIYPMAAELTTPATSHIGNLHNLMPDQTYFYQLCVTDLKETQVCLAEASFQTLDGLMTGDINGNGEIDADDIGILTDAILEDWEYEAVFDINDDGMVDIQDVVALIDLQ